MNNDNFINKLKSFKAWLFGLGLGGLAVGLWWLIKFIICLTTGICIIF